jgi:hypothetical protein
LSKWNAGGKLLKFVTNGVISISTALTSFTYAAIIYTRAWSTYDQGFFLNQGTSRLMAINSQHFANSMVSLSCSLSIKDQITGTYF